MRKVARARWISNFDMEDLISSILQGGMIIGLGFTLVSLALRWAETGCVMGVEEPIAGVSVTAIFLSDLRQIGFPQQWPSVTMRLAILVLLITPYVRVVASMVYFAVVERSWKQALFTGLVFIILTITLFTALV